MPLDARNHSAQRGGAQPADDRREPGYNARMTEQEPSPVRGPIAIESVPWREWSHGVRFGGRVRHLSQLFGDGYHVGVVIEELNKLMVRKLGVFDRSAMRDYWDGEHADEPHGG